MANLYLILIGGRISFYLFSFLLNLSESSYKPDLSANILSNERKNSFTIVSDFSI